jgi:hypothetical protein
MGLVRLSCKRWYWSAPDNTDGLFGVSFFRCTMGYRMWTAIDRCLQAELPVLSTLVNSRIKQLWTPYPDKNDIIFITDIIVHVAIDDDLDSWKGKRGRKKHLNKKADGTGQPNWKIVDSAHYCYHMFYEVDFPRGENDLPVAEFYLQELEKQLPPGIDQTVCCNWSRTILLCY